ncbi:hypothetical protein BB558_004258 [Smittium angustum]|uniref:Uncharacterized protein n=1 Tax=Smittium angustum TaxID=133377 RepID=A0A2U1J3S1_SMIAN|nr:hypothetical protein BB558_004258 [Smittium angustum]
MEKKKIKRNERELAEKRENKVNRDIPGRREKDQSQSKRDQVESERDLSGSERSSGSKSDQPERSEWMIERLIERDQDEEKEIKWKVRNIKQKRERSSIR